MIGCKQFVLSLVVLCGFVGMATPAQAQYVDPNEDIRLENEKDTNEFMVLARARAVKIPDFVLGIFFDEHASHWDGGVSNMSYGAEFVWRKNGEYEFSLGIDYADLSMASEFWRESGKSRTAAEFTKVDLQIVSVVFSSYWFWDVQEWFTPFVGGGIGPGIVLGDIKKFKATPGSPCYNRLDASVEGYGSPECLNANGEPNPGSFDVANPKIEDSVPAVIPMLNVSGGARFNLGKYAVLKLEAGFYTYVFAGASIGGQW